MEILSGIPEGAMVVTNPIAELIDGMHVHAVTASDQGSPAAARGSH